MQRTPNLPAPDHFSRRSLRWMAAVAGALYLLTFVTSIPALILYGPVLKDPQYILNGAADTQVRLGGFLEFVCALACIGTAIALFPVVRRQNEAVALGFIASRVLEAAIIVAGILSLLTVLTLRQQLANADSPDSMSLVVVGKALVAFHDWTFLLGPGLMPGVNGLLLGYLLYRSALIPRVIPLLGLVGGPLLLAAGFATLFGFNAQLSVWSGIATIPVFIWEASVGFWLLLRGFRPSAIGEESSRPAPTPLLTPA
jgi:hypothetical protein